MEYTVKTSHWAVKDIKFEFDPYNFEWVISNWSYIFYQKCKNQKWMEFQSETSVWNLGDGKYDQISNEKKKKKKGSSLLLS